jgi:hypothetical protein
MARHGQQGAVQKSASVLHKHSVMKTEFLAVRCRSYIIFHSSGCYKSEVRSASMKSLPFFQWSQEENQPSQRRDTSHDKQKHKVTEIYQSSLPVLTRSFIMCMEVRIWLPKRTSQNQLQTQTHQQPHSVRTNLRGHSPCLPHHLDLDHLSSLHPKGD